MKARNPVTETAIIVHPVLPKDGVERSYKPSPEEEMEEAIGLTRAIDLHVAATRIVRLSQPNAGYLIGKGVREEIGDLVQELKPNVVIVNHNLSPGQHRNLEKEWKAKVLDRTGLILEIFAARAQTSEGRIQVELAQLDYLRSRLVRLWTHLERQRGGGAFMGGPGERQMELDRRRIDERVLSLKRDLEKVRKNRELQRKGRERVPFPIVALVGYTNAGKSTLFNYLTGASVFAEDLLFATLDPTLRRIKLTNGQEIIMSDTVGFISDLPTRLVSAFRATLEQTQFADIIIHVRDSARPDTESQKEDVVSILADLGIEYETDRRIIEVMNKIDALDEDSRDDLINQARFHENRAAISALTGEGMDDLLKAIAAKLAHSRRVVEYSLPITDSKALAWLYDKGKVIERADNDNAIELRIDIEYADIGRFRERFSYEPVA